MEQEYVVLLDCSAGAVITIELTQQEMSLAAETEDFEEFLSTLEDKYHFDLRDCCWMRTNHLIERKYYYEKR